MNDPLDPIRHSVSFEQLLEQRFLSEVTAEMWFGRHRLVDVLSSRSDSFGYDLVLETSDVVRHVQLKSKRHDSRPGYQKVSTLLATRPAGCVVVLVWKQLEHAPWIDLSFRWFGGAPGAPLPPLGDRVSKHAKGDATGKKNERPMMRDVAMGRFTTVADVGTLCDLLFGPGGDEPVESVEGA